MKNLKKFGDFIDSTFRSVLAQGRCEVENVWDRAINC